MNGQSIENHGVVDELVRVVVKTASVINKKVKYGRDQNESGVLDA